MHVARPMRPNRAILVALANAERPINRYELERDYTKLAKRTIYDWIRRMKILNWIIEKTEMRYGRLVKYYELTDLGLFRAARYACDPARETPVSMRGSADALATSTRNTRRRKFLVVGNRSNT